jgi:hypothetical protein
MQTVIGEATGPANEKRALLVEALQQALENAPPPSPGNDIQHFRLVSVELEHGGFVLNTRTRVTLEFADGPLPPPAQ